MQNYGQQPPAAYQRPGSTTSFASAPAPPPVPPAYGTPQSQNQWAAPAPSHGQNQSQNQGQQWGQQAQQTGGYNPNIYGAMPGGYSQAQAAPSYNAPAYPPQQDAPPPPPPKPASFAASVAQQQNSQGYPQQSTYSTQPPQHNSGYDQGIGGYTSQGVYQAQAIPQPYNNAAPPPPSQTPGGSYPPSSQGPPLPARPGSIYGAAQAGTPSTPVSAGSHPLQQHPDPSATASYTQSTYSQPPSYTYGYAAGQNQSSTPVSAVSQPPIQQQSGPSAASNYTQSLPPTFSHGQQYQASQSSHPAQQGQYEQNTQNQYAPPAPIQPQGHYAQQESTHYPAQHNPYGHNVQPQQNQTAQSPAHFQQQNNQSYNQYPPQSQTPQQINQQPSQWGPPENQQYGQQQQPTQQPVHQQGWQQGHQTQNSYSNQQQQQNHHQQGQTAGIQAPQPMNGNVGTASQGFVNEPSPQSQPVSPLAHRQTMSFGSQHDIGRTDSISSIALGSIHAQRVENRTESPRPAPSNAPPPRDTPSQFSALGMGGPSDWEHFGGEGDIDDEELLSKKENDKASTTVELPAVVPASSVSSNFPSPPDQPLQLHQQRPDDFQPTPDLSERGTPTQKPPHVQQSFAVHDGGRHTPVHGTPAQQQNFVMSDGGWSASAATPQNLSQAYTTAERSRDPVAQGISQNENDARMQQANQELEHKVQQLESAIQSKDNDFEALNRDIEQQQADSRREIDELSVVLETVKKHAEQERKALDDQLKVLKATVEQGNTDREALLKEKDNEIERWKEDGEGKDNSVKEKEGIIADLNKQLRDQNTAIEELKKELETEKSKVPPQPTAAALIPDIDPWYAGSLERYIAMLRGEASEAKVEDKIKTFTAFMKNESGIRGLEYYNTPPPAPAVRELVKQPTPPAAQRKSDLNVQVPQPAESPTDDIQYSPGGRPVMLRRGTIPASVQPASGPSEPFTQSGTILTPTSSQDDDYARNPVSIQSPPEQQSQPQYKAYVPPGGSQADPTKPLLNQSMSFANSAPVAPLQTPGSGKVKDDMFFGGSSSQTSSRPGSRPTTGTPSEVPLPLPLSTPKPLGVSRPKSTEQKDPLQSLKTLIPSKITPSKASPQLERVRQKMSTISSDTTFITTLTTSWDKTVTKTRKENADARHKRQEESEAHTDQLFNDHEISYADIGDIEDEFKEKERELKAQEDRAEYASYNAMVFEKVYSTLQEQIKSLTDISIDAESLLQTSASGVKTLDGGDGPTTEESLKIFHEVHQQIEKRHEDVAAAVSERDKRYKKTEVQPLYAAGNIVKMKTVEKHFENAEKQGVARAKAEKAQRAKDFYSVVEDIVIEAISVEQREIEGIANTLQHLSSSSPEDDDVKDTASRARETIAALKTSSKSLLAHLHALEIDLHASEADAALAHAKASNSPPEEIAELEKEKTRKEGELKEEFERKIKVVEQDDGEGIGGTTTQWKGGKKDGGSSPRGGRGPSSGSVVQAPTQPQVQVQIQTQAQRNETPPLRLSEEEEKRIRLEKALEAAKRRNGDL
ncbi:unnamed protein product [Periconia digitata]|uniref:Uncharacterized protein n=1 Tax=Periconia digitata TaxID=1303443 RepID=A0A9W4UUU9_9PLEO|nr:unnamed protein product [Periconia digitata]